MGSICCRGSPRHQWEGQWAIAAAAEEKGMVGQQEAIENGVVGSVGFL